MTREALPTQPLTHSDGTCVRDYLHVMDLADGHVLALDAIDKGDIFAQCDPQADGMYRAFNLGKGKGMSVLDMIEAMRKASGFDYQYEIVGRRYVSFFCAVLLVGRVCGRREARLVLVAV